VIAPENRLIHPYSFRSSGQGFRTLEEASVMQDGVGSRCGIEDDTSCMKTG
jgi:hypothetical protein